MSAEPTPPAALPADPPLRDAATVIVLRDRKGPRPSVLMGQRGAKAAFMPEKFVFPGGAVDPGDHSVPLAQGIGPTCAARLQVETPKGVPHALCVAAVRELWEETGLLLADAAAPWREGVPEGIPEDWRDFAAQTGLPRADAMRFCFRAITPFGRPRRFDARFFLLDAEALQGDLDDFSRASDELSHLQWVPLADTRRLDLPFITEVVLAEITAQAACDDAPEQVPFFLPEAGQNIFRYL